jgi:hypothetical protein
LPWDLFLVGDGLLNPTKVSREQLEESMERSAGENYQDHASLKRRKIDHASIRALSAGVMYDFSKPGSELSACSNSYAQSNEELMSCNLSDHEISCSVTVRGVNCNSQVSSGILHCTSDSLNGGGGCGPSARKVLLEFKSESFFKYQVCLISFFLPIFSCSNDSLLVQGCENNAALCFSLSM